MSDESARAFLAASFVSDVLRARINAVQSACDASSAGQALAAVGTAEGYDFSLNELAAARDAFMEEKILENVRGSSGSVQIIEVSGGTSVPGLILPNFLGQLGATSQSAQFGPSIQVGPYTGPDPGSL